MISRLDSDNYFNNVSQFQRPSIKNFCGGETTLYRSLLSNSFIGYLDANNLLRKRGVTFFRMALSASHELRQRVLRYYFRSILEGRHQPKTSTVSYSAILLLSASRIIEICNDYA